MDTLAFVWYLLIGFVVIMYVILDGFDLGVGILSMFVREERQRDLMVSAILPVWDGNETWLVLGGAMLYGAFPKAFATILPSLYIPLIFMVVALLFRGITFEFRLKAHGAHKQAWEIAFFVGSLAATIIQGLVLGTFVQGFDRVTTTQDYLWLSPYSIACAIAMVFGYMLLGANWLVAKTHDDLQDFALHVSKFALVVVGFFMFFISLWTPYIHPFITQRWFDPMFIPYIGVLPAIAAILFIYHWQSLKNPGRHEAPFWYSIGIFLTAYLGFGISTFPYIVPHMITFTAAAAPHTSLKFMLYGAAVMLPVLLFYTFYSYKIFRGKVHEVVDY